jgi:hypothetical protein
MDVLWYRDAVHRWLRPDRTLRDHTTSGMSARDPRSAAVTWDEVWQGRAEIWVSGNPEHRMPRARSAPDPDPHSGLTRIARSRWLHLASSSLAFPLVLECLADCSKGG